MLDFFDFLIGFWNAIIAVLNRYTFSIGSYDVTLAGVLFACLVISFVVTVFWKGAKG